MDIKQIVGKNIQTFRKLNNYTQEQLAEMIRLETISLSRIETGKNYPTSENLAKIAEILNVEPYRFYIPESEPSEAEIMENILKLLNQVKNDKKRLKTIKRIIETVLEQE